jgi:threonine dehydratase
MVVRTPPVLLHSYARPNGILLEPEVLQPTGSFKLRGVYNWAICLTAEERERGLSTFSSGNTAQALGYVGRLFGVPARSVLPDTTPDSKTEAIRKYGAEPVLPPEAELQSNVFEARWEQEPHGFIMSWTDPMMIAGKAAIGAETVSDLADVDTVYVPIGGGNQSATICRISREHQLESLPPGRQRRIHEQNLEEYLERNSRLGTQRSRELALLAAHHFPGTKPVRAPGARSPCAPPPNPSPRPGPG